MADVEKQHERPLSMSSGEKTLDAQLENDHNKELPEISGVQQDPNIAFTQEDEDRVFRKLDYRLLPFVFVLYSLSVLDRSNLGNARLAGLEEAIDLTGFRYNW